MNTGNSVDINGEKIRRLREQRELTQLYLATVVGVTTDTISRWENRRYPSIKIENARKLAEALEVPLEDLLSEPEIVGQPVDPSPSTAVENSPPSESAPQTAAAAPPLRRRAWILAAVVAIILAALAANSLLHPPSGIEAVRIMPRHTAPNLPFPVLIRVTGPVEAANPLLIREELKGDVTANGFSPDGPPKKFERNPRWIGKLENGQAAFLYLVEPGRRLKADDSIAFSGDLVSQEGQIAGDTIEGPDKVVIAPYHWADTDRDYVISDAEILKAHETYLIPGENLINFNALEELWMAGRYGWDKKSQGFVPVASADGKP